MKIMVNLLSSILCVLSIIIFVQGQECSDIDYSTQVFYYCWYGNPETDGDYIHWNHAILPHWTSEMNKKYDVGRKYDPEKGEIGSVYFPLRGLFSSRDKETIKDQFIALLEIGINVVVLSYWGRNRADGDGVYFSDRIFRIFEAAEEVGISISIHLEPFWNYEREEEKKLELIRDEIDFILSTFGNSSSLLRIPVPEFSVNPKKTGHLPLIYLYDSYLIPSGQWNRILNPQSEETLRGTEFDAIFIGLYLNPNPSESHIINSHFDGFYSYFGSTGFTYASNPKNWKSLNEWAKGNDLIFIPSVGPGYNDERIRPWNQANTKSREHGNYYRRMFDKAVEVYDPNYNFISITSFNEWGEGTQIEECEQGKLGFEDYEDGPRMYLEITQKYIKKLKNKRTKLQKI